MEQYTPLSTSAYRRNLICILFIYALDSFGIAIAYPVFAPLFFGDISPFFSASDPQFYRVLFFGLMLSLFPLTQFIGVPFLGDYSDKAGRKKTFTFTLFGSVFGYALAAAGIYYRSFTLLCISRLCGGFFAGNTSICFASLADMSTSDQNRSKNFGIMASLGGLSFVASIALGEYFLTIFPQYWAPALPFAMLSLLSLVAFFLLIFLFHEQIIIKRKVKFQLAQGYRHILSTLENETLKPAYLLYFFFAISWISVMQFYPSNLIVVYHQNPLSLTYNLLAIGILWFLANSIAQRFLIRYFTSAQILWGTIPLLLLFFLCSLLPQSYISFSVHFSIAIFIAALTWVNSITNISLRAPKEIQGRIMGVNQSFAALATLTASLGGAIFAAINPSFIFVFSAACVFASFIFLRKQAHK
ncbi:MAG: MFS transporter [Rhabdochlamydiaceae bacterium]|nr:MFS transporter [Rhabdochlamydiaceae bacterium]